MAPMPKFLIEGPYLAESLRGLAKGKTLERRAAAKDALAALGRNLEGAFYAAFALAASVSGLIGARTIHPGVSALDRIAVRWGRSNL